MSITSDVAGHSYVFLLVKNAGHCHYLQ